MGYSFIRPINKKIRDPQNPADNRLAPEHQSVPKTGKARRWNHSKKFGRTPHNLLMVYTLHPNFFNFKE
jgi:hypothetical protein